MKRYLNCLSIAGSDPYGGAGVQADLKTFSALGCYGATVITALTVQNSEGVRKSVATNAQLVYEQAEAVFEDIPIDAVKIGMTVNKDIIEITAKLMEKYRPRFVILDPVMVSSSGHRLLDEEAVAVLKKQLIPLCDLVTPNIPELSVLSGGLDSTMTAAHKLIDETGCRHVLIKGGHRDGEPTDVLVSAKKHWEYPGHRVNSQNTHGTGCTLSSAIAAFSAQGIDLPEAVGEAKKYIERALQTGADVFAGKGHGSMNHFFKGQRLIIKDF